MKGISIRWRLTLWYSGVLALVLVLFGTAIYVLMGRQLQERIDAGLREELADVLSEVRRAKDSPGMLVWLNRRFAHHEGFDFQITTMAGKRIFTNPRLGERWLPIPKLKSESTGEVFRSEDLGAEVGRWRIISQRVPGPEGELTVQVGRSLGAFDHERAELLLVLLVTGPLALALAVVGGWILAGRALAPVDRMRRSADRITAQKLDQRLVVANCDDELGRLAETLNTMIERLERSFREMQRFTADASHELRTPIAVIRAEAEISLEKPLTEREKQELLSNILEECQRLTWITDQLLTLSREDAGIATSHRESVDISNLIQKVIDDMRPLAEAKEQSLTLSLNGPATVSGDPQRLRQVFYNVLDNAIKYTPRKGDVSVSVCSEEKGKAVVAVKDTGIGIPAEHLPHVFDRFYRVDKARSRAEGGTGLGLSIVDSIVSAHGGRVRLKSNSGEGTTCHIILPLKANGNRITIQTPTGRNESGLTHHVQKQEGIQT